MTNHELSKHLKDNAIEHSYLYHYTTIETLLRIIESKSFRFSRVDKVNDPVEEERASRTENDYYICCFTHNVRESITLWHMYANSDKGVRIGVKNIDFFTGDAFYYDGSNKVFFHDEIISSDNNHQKIIRLNNGYVQLDGPYKTDVLYANNDLKRNFVENNQYGGLSIKKVYPYILIGIKGEAWDYEAETRYYISLPLYNRLNIEYLFLCLSDKFFQGLKITFNPFIQENEKEKIVYKIKQKISINNFNTIHFKHSDLSGKIKLK